METIFRNIKSFAGLLFAITVISQGFSQTPVVCFESDGHIATEINCTQAPCDVQMSKQNTHTESCHDCLDVPFWLLAPELNTVSFQNHQLSPPTMTKAAPTLTLFKPTQNFTASDQNKIIISFPTQHLLALQATVLLL